MTYPLSIEPGSSKKNKTGVWRQEEYPEIDKEVCIGCNTCFLVCPEGICEPSGKTNSKGKKYYQIDLDYCKGCGICVNECPVKAIKMKKAGELNKKK